LPFQEVVDHFTHGKPVSELFFADQLKLQMQEGAVFDDWNEPEVTFVPTYRLLRNTFDEHARRVYNDEKLRVPSWCDRILYRSFPETELEVGKYDSCPTVDSSDHCPVYATFSLDTVLSPRLATSTLLETSPAYGRCFFSNLKANSKFFNFILKVSSRAAF